MHVPAYWLRGRRETVFGPGQRVAADDEDRRLPLLPGARSAQPLLGSHGRGGRLLRPLDFRHYHRWIDAQGHSPFVWSVIGALAQATKHSTITTAVTCPTVRTHPAVIAQAAATSAVLLEGRFRLGVGSGEALNEHILGDPGPRPTCDWRCSKRRSRSSGRCGPARRSSTPGRHYRVENAQLYTRPDEPPPILVSGFGPKAVDLAARVGDGYCITMPDPDLIGRFRSRAGDKRVEAGTKVCYGADRDAAVATAHRLWPNEALPGELAQVLPQPAHFEQASELVTEEMVAASARAGPDHYPSTDQFDQSGPQGPEAREVDVARNASGTGRAASSGRRVRVGSRADQSGARATAISGCRGSRTVALDRADDPDGEARLIGRGEGGADDKRTARTGATPVPPVTFPLPWS